MAGSISPLDPGWVKTCTSQECAELFSLSSSRSGGRKHFWFSNLRNRDGISTRRLNIGVFTRPRPTAEVGPQEIGTPGRVQFRSSIGAGYQTAIGAIESDASRVDASIRGDVIDLASRNPDVHQFRVI